MEALTASQLSELVHINNHWEMRACDEIVFVSLMGLLILGAGTIIRAERNYLLSELGSLSVLAVRELTGSQNWEHNWFCKPGEINKGSFSSLV